MDTVPFLLCELGAPLFTNLKGAGTYFMCIPAMNRRMYKGYDTSRVVVEQNLQIIPQDQLENTLIQEGDQIEILCFVGGG